MADYKIEVGVKHKGSSGGGSPMRSGMAGSGEDIARKFPAGMRPMSQNQRLDNKKMQSMQKSTTFLQKISENIVRLLQETKMLKKNAARNSGGGSGGGGGGGGGMPRGKVGLIIAGIKALVGVTVAAGKKAFEIGRMSANVGAKQLKTAGIGGFQTSGTGIYGADEIGGFEAARRRDLRNPMGRGSRSGRLRGNLYKYGAAFGKDANELGRTAGLADMFTGGKGSEAIGKTLGESDFRGEMSTFMSALTSSLEKAVSSGIKNSDLATKMGKTIGYMQARTTNQSIKPALKFMERVASASESVRGGSVNDLKGYFTYSAAHDRAKEILSGKGENNKELKAKLTKEGIIGENQDEASQMMNLRDYVLTREEQEVGNRAFNKQRDLSGKTAAERRSGALVLKQAGAFDLVEMSGDPKKSGQTGDAYLDKNSDLGYAGRVKSNEVARENMLLTKNMQKLGNVYLKTNKKITEAMSYLANNTEGAARAIKAFEKVVLSSLDLFPGRPKK